VYPSAEFLRSVAPLSVPSSGTDRVAPMLYHLVQFARPARVLEIGMGYTTPFLAQALRDLDDTVESESEALAAKSAQYEQDERALDEAWLEQPPALASPEFYLAPYEPELVAVDDLSSGKSSARHVGSILEDLGLADLVTTVDSKLADLPESTDPAFVTPFDLVWLDAWDCLTFFEECWHLVSPGGGLLVMHYLLTYPEGAAILEYLKSCQRTQPGSFELVSILEPHKLAQNSITVLRRTDGYADANHAPGGAVRFTPELHEAARNHAHSRTHRH
jgi:predicted O-methyltransferase YrrM